MIPGEYILAKEPIEANAGLTVVAIGVTNTGDRPVQVGSHFHFFETNRQLVFNREAAFGCRLNIPAGTAVRFEPGEQKEVELVAFGGRRIVTGFSNLVNGEATSAGARARLVAIAIDQHFKNSAP